MRTTDKPIDAIQEPKHQQVIFKGLGLSFDSTPEEVSAQGFKPREGLRPMDIGVWRALSIPGSKESWTSKHIKFTPITHKVKSFGASDAYPPKPKSTLPGCYDDYLLIIDKIKRKYPTLTVIPNSAPISWIKSTRLCEGYTVPKYIGGKQGLGRCIEVICSSNAKDDKDWVSKSSSLLTVDYFEDYWEYAEIDNKERRKFIDLHRDDALKKSGINPDTF